MKKIGITLVAALLAVGLSLTATSPASAVTGGCGKGKVSCRSTIWYNFYH